MTAKTTRGRDVSDDARAEATSAAEPPVEELEEREETAEVEAEPATARVAPKKRVRRVRVIEVVDDEDDGLEDEDLEELLEALDDEDEPARKPARKAPAAQEAEPKAAEPKAAEPVVTAPAEAEDETSPSEAGKTEVTLAKAKAAEGTTGQASGVRTVLGSSALTKALVAVLVVALGGFSVWQWRQAAGLSSDKDARQEVATAAGAYGNIVYTYSPATVQQNINDNLRMLSGDLLSTYKQTTAVNLPEFFKKSPNVSMASKIKQVFVGDVNGDLATAVLLIDVTIKTDKGPIDGSNTLLRLALKKDKGAWKVTQQKTSGEGDETAATGQLQLPNNGTTGTAPTTAPAPSGTATP